MPRHLTAETEDLSWQEFANCLGVDPDLFFPERGASTRAAKEVCRGCQVRESCLEFALANGEKFGIWGGMSERERRRIRRQRAPGRNAALQGNSALPGNAALAGSAALQATPKGLQGRPRRRARQVLNQPASADRRRPAAVVARLRDEAARP